MPAPNQVELALFLALIAHGVNRALAETVSYRFAFAVEEGEERCAARFGVSLRTVKRDRALVAELAAGDNGTLGGRLSDRRAENVA